MPLEAGFWFVAADRDVDEEADNDDEADDVVVVVAGLDDAAAGLVDAAAAAAAAVFEMFSRAFKLSELENGAGAEVAVVAVVVAVSPVLAGVARRCAGFLRCSFHARLRTAGALFTGSNDRFNSKSSSIVGTSHRLTSKQARERCVSEQERRETTRSPEAVPYSLPRSSLCHPPSTSSSLAHTRTHTTSE